MNQLLLPKNCDLPGLWHGKIPVCLLLLLILLITGCAKKVIPALPEGTTFDRYLAELNSIKSIKFVFSISINRGDNNLTGRASMLIDGEDADLRVYSMGFLVSEVKVSNGKITVEGKRISNENALLLIEALRSCLMWWDLEEMEVEGTGPESSRNNHSPTIIRNSWRKVYLDKNYIPYLQEIVLPRVAKVTVEAPTVMISYEIPKFYPAEYFYGGGLWYPSRIIVKLPKGLLASPIGMEVSEAQRTVRGKNEVTINIEKINIIQN